MCGSSFLKKKHFYIHYVQRTSWVFYYPMTFAYYTYLQVFSLLITIPLGRLGSCWKIRELRPEGPAIPLTPVDCKLSGIGRDQHLAKRPVGSWVEGREYLPSLPLSSFHNYSLCNHYVPGAVPAAGCPLGTEAVLSHLGGAEARQGGRL